MDLDLKLTELCTKLQKIKDDLVKLPKVRRQGNIFERKIDEAKELYSQFNEIHNILLEGKVSNNILLLCLKIQDNYSKILCLESTNLGKMAEKSEKFCLKTAVGLLPKLNGRESVTKELIEAIDLYDSMLSDDGRMPLINFVLKTRLDEGSKMRLNASYSTVADLLLDMRRHLLTSKSDTALQSQLQSARQGNKSIQQFGSEIERLFVDLTISQAKGNDQAYNVLRPLNERNAIKRFSEGLQSQRLGTIISARNFSYLKDAVRAAEDETIGSSNQVMFGTRNNNFQGRGYFNNRAHHFNNRARGNYFYPRSYQNNNFVSYQNAQGGNYVSRGAATCPPNRGGQQFSGWRGGRGGNTRGNRYQRGQPRAVNYVTASDNAHNQVNYYNNNYNDNGVEFFRE